MKKSLLGFGLIILLFSISCSLNGQVRLPAFFADNMVLQQKSEVTIWGKANMKKVVELTTSWDKKTYKTQTGKDGKWGIKIITPKAGGPFNITISDGKLVTINNILIGEVWFCSGQSNMVMPMKGYYNQPVLNSQEDIVSSANDNIRLFTANQIAPDTIQDDVLGNWQGCTPATVKNFSATAYYFGKLLQKVLNVPVGLINSSVGGTRIEEWMNDEAYSYLEKIIEKGTLNRYMIEHSKRYYNTKIHPFAGLAVKGIIWYQGESNRDNLIQYENLFKAFIRGWREVWGVDDMPVYYCQIAPFHYYPDDPSTAFLRDAQLKVSLEISNTGMASLIDVGDEWNVHPGNKKATGTRLAYIALAKTYGIKGIEYSGPIFNNMETDSNLVKLTFNHAENGLTTYGKELTHFEVAGRNKRFYPATKAFITKKGITVISPMNDPVAVRYAFKDFVTGELYNTEGLPASSFRTDNWEIK